MLRAVLWGWSMHLIRATWIASGAGRLLGILLIVLGVVEVVRGDFVGGVWLSLIGIFLRGAAGATYEQTLARQILGGQPVSRFMNKRPIAVSPDLSVRSLVEDYVCRHHHKVLPVVREGRLLGCVTTAQISAIDEGEWDQRSVAEIMEPCSPDNTVTPETDALEAMTKMQRTGRSPFLVVSRGQLVGLLSPRDLLELFALKLELGEGRRQVAVQPQAG
jgi:CBS domain-containing protein